MQVPPEQKELFAHGHVRLFMSQSLKYPLDAGSAILPSLMAQKRIEFNLPLFQEISLGSRESRQ